jgi:hypothetical protein
MQPWLLGLLADACRLLLRRLHGLGGRGLPCHWRSAAPSLAEASADNRTGLAIAGRGGLARNQAIFGRQVAHPEVGGFRRVVRVQIRTGTTGQKRCRNLMQLHDALDCEHDRQANQNRRPGVGTLA